MKIKRFFTILLIILFISLVYKRFNMKTYSPENVEFSYEEKNESIILTMKSKEDYQIYYTLDGSIPTKSSLYYTKPIELNRYSTPDTLVRPENREQIYGNDIKVAGDFPKGVVVRAIAIAPDKTKGDVETETFFPGLIPFYQNAPIISLVTDPDNLLNYDRGIMINGKYYDEWKDTKEGKKILEERNSLLYQGNYTQRGKKWEREAVIEYFEGSNESLWKENCGIRIQGNFARMYNQKGFNIYFRDEYGNNKLEYPIFSNNTSIDGQLITNYKRISLKNGGNTIDGLKFTDDFLQSLITDRHVDTQKGRLVVVFINGEYWGVYLLQEKYSSDYFAQHYGVHRKNIISVSEGNIDIGEESDISYYHDLMKYSEMDLTNEDIYQEFLSKIDLQSMLDYYAIETYIENADWGYDFDLGIEKNTRLWRTKTSDGSTYGDGKWRWSIYDLGYYAASSHHKESNYCYLEQVLIKHPLFGSAMKNDKFRKAFYETYEDIRIHNFNPRHVEEVFQSYLDLWNPYMMDHTNRFGSFGFIGYVKIHSTQEVLHFFQNKYQESVC